MTNKEKWQAWNEERDSFTARNTEGFSQDLKALEHHIKKITRVCPKDNAGWPVLKALSVITKLTRDYDTFKTYLRQNNDQETTP